MPTLNKYFNQYAEPEVALTDSLLHHKPVSSRMPKIFRHCVVIPAYKESDDFVKSFTNSRLVYEDVLLIVIVNQPDCDPNQEIQQCLYNSIVSTGRALVSQPQNPPLQLVQLANSGSCILLVDRFSSGRKILRTQGVGLARKIGCDIASYLIHHEIIRSPWICSTDADAQLPNNYFAVLPHLPSGRSSLQSVTDKGMTFSALTYGFNHANGEREVQQATEIYQRALKYYVDGLRFANSAYAFFTIGSILAFNYKHYCLVRGFPKKSAGEDFYLLNKLAKLGPIIPVKEATITLTSRYSDRVPFGTGPAVTKIMRLADPEHQYMYYNPKIFFELRRLLSNFGILWKAMQRQEENIDIWLSILPTTSLPALEYLGFSNFVKCQQQQRTEQQFNRQLHEWFDAFKTVKYVHYLRRHYLPDVPLSKAIAGLAKLKGG